MNSKTECRLYGNKHKDKIQAFNSVELLILLLVQSFDVILY